MNMKRYLQITNIQISIFRNEKNSQNLLQTFKQQTVIEVDYQVNFFFLRLLLGEQLSSRCLSIDGSSSKCWSILTHPKRREPSLDIW